MLNFHTHLNWIAAGAVAIFLVAAGAVAGQAIDDNPQAQAPGNSLQIALVKPATAN